MPFSIIDMINKPDKFFRKKLSIVSAIIYFLVADFGFTFMTQTLVFLKIVPSITETSFFTSVLINFFSIIAGFCFIIACIILVNLFLGGKNHLQIVAVMLYSVVPSLIFVWIPFIFIQIIALLWSMILVMIGVKSKEGFNDKKAVAYPIMFIVLTIILTIISQNYIFLGFLK
ncbi:MAG: YIP1 family protein [Candidatus Aenigmarchaeota archaeon]|nr:YIP1 family protein [Candidatus Aenigmarchaeota archaeon]